MGHLLADEIKAHIEDDEVEEDKQDVDDNTHDELQLADHAPRILQSIRQVLALLVDLHTNTFFCCSCVGWQALHVLQKSVDNNGCPICCAILQGGMCSALPDRLHAKNVALAREEAKIVGLMGSCTMRCSEREVWADDRAT